MAREAIFIGYRREDTADVAGRIYDALAARFGRQRIFKDVDNLRPGADFGAHIRALLPRCRVVLVLIGPNWLEARDERGQRRIDDPHDWVRIEIELALATPGLDVVPVLVNGARMPRTDELPESLHPLLRRHAATIRRDPDFHDDVGKLTAALRQSVGAGVLDLSALGGEKKAAAARPAPRGERRQGMMFVGGIVAALTLVAVGYGAWRVLGTPAPAPVSVAERDAQTPPSENTPAPQPESPAAPATQAPTPAPQTRVPQSRASVELPAMVRIPGGEFLMGSPASEPGRNTDEGPQRTVRITAFYMSRTEVTFAQWDACLADGGCNGYSPPDQGWGRGNRPVINVSWSDAQAYVEWLSRRTGQRYRLPTEAEWEYAARAGTTTAYHTGESISTGQANFNHRLARTQTVGAYAANAFGLYDIHGNAWEWVLDCYSDSYSGRARDGSAYQSDSCSFRVTRGGSWGSDVSGLRSADRLRLLAVARLDYVGFRVARSG